MPRTPSTWVAVVVIWLIAFAAELAILVRIGVFRGRASTGTGGLVGITASLWQFLALLGIPLGALAVTWLWLRQRGP